MNLILLGDRVAIKPLVNEEKTKSGIVLSGQKKENSQQAVVVAVGQEVTMQIKLGDKVVCSNYAGTKIKLGEEEYIFVTQNDILAVIDEVRS
ncbi:co-chaperone GroES [Anaerobium acetethylicum]|uniref:Co-chaperonin GroES n=1 Tax=Anaerobium acetethylicum TaxID=1619234 RepID=A0A1D3TW51_9FIRM|nr:co-chaperone GroES [Anaerobium acetethylicum]SCP98417.1 chaperonin GroES [Anaerobium acetethylicum]